VRHALILGVGFCSYGSTNGVNASDVRGIGIVADRGLTVGIAQRHEIAIDPSIASNAVVSFRATPFSMTFTNWTQPTGKKE
jgi:hypothetical protein